jgi:hypothetical protein
MITYDFDYETYYDRDFSVKTLGNWMYTHDERFDAYLLTVEGDNGYEWAGNPKEFDWERFNGQIGVAHNAGFDFAVTERLKELGIAPAFTWAELYDTADLAAYLGYPRSLASASFHLLGVSLSKEIRDKAKGKHWNEMTPEFQKQMLAYGKNDSKIGLRLWKEHGHKMPQWERELSRLTREMCWRGVPTDPAKVKAAITNLETRLITARSLIPWVKDNPEAPVLSLKQAGLEARKHGVAPPKSFAKDSEEFAEWVTQYGEKFPWARGLGEYRSVNMLLQKLITLKERTDSSGVFRYGLKYFGAHTGRDSGDSGFNPQNLARKPMFGVDVRGCVITAPKGYILGIADEAAIQPKIVTLFSKDKEILDLLHKGQDIYEAQARISHGYTNPEPLKESDPDFRKHMKVELLGCMFGAGAAKVQIIAKQQVGLDISFSEAEKIVNTFRKRKFIPNLWKHLESQIAKSAPGDWELELPSGRIMNYRNVRSFGNTSAEIPRLGKMLRVKLWGGTLCENLAQAVERDIVMWHVLQIVSAGFQILLRAHDELVLLLKESEAETKLAEALAIMSQPPPWLKEFPAGAEGQLSKSYKKI